MTATNLALVGARSRRLSWSVVIPLFSTTLFVGSFLMFMVEPMIAKMVLPILGGTPMVWNTCVVFFQILLLGGYAYAHAVNAWVRFERHTILYAILLLAPLPMLPFAIATGSDAAAHPIVWLFLVLLTSVGPVFFVLSTCASMFQKWFSMTDHAAARDPYFLYAASNLGSLIALAAYPSVIEPTLRLDEQSRLWATGYALFAMLALAGVIVVRRLAFAARSEAAAIQAANLDGDVELTWPIRARWVLLAFVPSSLMLGVTSYMSTDIAAVPLLWILPLWLYLLSFVITFGSNADAARNIANRAWPVLVLPLAMVMIAQVRSPLSLVIPLHLLVFAAAAVLCHAELAHNRPASKHLTRFYFWIAFGGMAGGLFNTLLAPVFFNRIVEYPLALGLACLLRPRAYRPGERLRLFDVLVPACVSAATLILIFGAGRLSMGPRLPVIAFGVLAVLAFSQAKRTIPFAISVGAMLLAAPWAGSADEPVLHAERTFFGVYRVNVDRTSHYHALAHGTTLHGMQALAAARQDEPLTYFHRTGPFGQAFAALPQLSTTAEVAVVGLGIGTLATYATPGQQWTFYEIDPALERIARRPEYFTFLRQCGARCRVVLGDGRLSIAAAHPQQYGLIVLDAFSSDAIPMHLLTSEALSLYLARLAPSGVLAFNISNRHLLLNSVLGRLATAHNLVALEQREVFTGNASWPRDKSDSHWVMMARDRADLGALIGDSRWTPPSVKPSTPLWTDDFSNLLGVLSLR